LIERSEDPLRVGDEKTIGSIRFDPVRDSVETGWFQRRKTHPSLPAPIADPLREDFGGLALLVGRTVDEGEVLGGDDRASESETP
jgi:hypothetical protein